MCIRDSFCNESYNRLQVDAVPPKTDLEVYQTALAEGKITEKERLLWEYVLSAYGAEDVYKRQLILRQAFSLITSAPTLRKPWKNSGSDNIS